MVDDSSSEKAPHTWNDTQREREREREREKQENKFKKLLMWDVEFKLT